MKKSSSVSKLRNAQEGLGFRRPGNQLTGSMHENMDANKVGVESSVHSFEIVENDFTNDNLNLDYIDEIELNQAFSVFEKNI